MKEESSNGDRAVESPGFWQAFWVWVKIGLLSFGGPTGQIGLMHRELVERRRWISDRRFLHALNYCMLLPGPEAQQLAIYVGWLLHRALGGIVAGLLFVLPGALLMGLVSYVYIAFGEVPLIQAIFDGLKPAVIAIVAAAMLRIGQKVLKHPALWLIALAAFVSIFFLNLPFPLIILGAGSIGWIAFKMGSQAFSGGGHGHGSPEDEDAGYAIGEDSVERIGRFSILRSIRSGALWLGIWLAPLLACLAILGRGHVLTEMSLFFSKVAMVTFGGAYAVLPYVAQQAVEQHAWLSAAEMMDGLGLAETTPGPLVLVLQFVAFLGGWAAETGASALLMAMLASFITCWMIFVPGYLFVFAGAPLFEGGRSYPGLASALTAITAAVVGVILNLAVWFGVQVIMPEAGVFHLFSMILATVCFVLLKRFGWDVLWVIAIGASAGVAQYLLIA